MAFDLTGAYVAASLLGALAILAVLGMNALRRAIAPDHAIQEPLAPPPSSEPVGTR
jgi:hypothetical protein